MSAPIKALILIIGITIGAIGLTACNTLPDHPGRPTFERACARCHETSKILKKTKTRKGWQRTVNVMRRRGARLNDEEAKLVVDYLVEVRGGK
jgi:nitrate/TMAO reductase-like tetraheme cytochrome c subunit